MAWSFSNSVVIAARLRVTYTDPNGGEHRALLRRRCWQIAPYTLTIVATWAGSNAPGGATASVDAAFGDTDPNLANNMVTQLLSAPTPVTTALFKNGFE